LENYFYHCRNFDDNLLKLLFHSENDYWCDLDKELLDKFPQINIKDVGFTIWSMYARYSDKYNPRENPTARNMYLDFWLKAESVAIKDETDKNVILENLRFEKDRIISCVMK